MSAMLERRGDYSARIVLQARGGLIAQYYRTPGFQSMVVQGSDRQHPGDSPVEFTQVDPVLALEWPAEPVVSCPEDYWSARWYGYLLPKATGTHVLRIESDFASRVTLGSTVIIDAMDSVTAVRERAQVTL